MQLHHWIDGEAREPASGQWLPVFDPARGTPFAEVARGNAADVDAAVDAARRAAPAWAALANDARAAWLEQLAAALEAKLDDFAHAEARDGGKPLRLAREAEERAAREAAEEAARLEAEERAQAEAKAKEAEENERIARLLSDEAERKAKRDARYAARKARAGRH